MHGNLLRAQLFEGCFDLLCGNVYHDKLVDTVLI